MPKVEPVSGVIEPIWSRQAAKTMLAGCLLLRALYLSLDPYMRGRMDDRRCISAERIGNAVFVA